MYLYLNNFKGFTDTIIPLLKVNFLVGENSTGKSTVLSILDLFSKSSFWMDPQFNTAEYRFGPFNELVNLYSSDKSFFQVGAEFQSTDLTNLSERRRVMVRILESFKENEGNIVLDSIRFTHNSKTYYCKFQKNKTVLVSRREKAFPSFINWIRSTPPLRERAIPCPENYLHWLPGLMTCVTSAFDDDKTMPVFYSPLELYDFVKISPIRAEAHRIYESFSQSFSPTGEHVPIMLNKLLNSNSTNSKLLKKKLYSFGTNSGLYDSIKTSKYGETSDAPFSLSVFYGDNKLNLTNVGYGVSQVLPLVVEILRQMGDNRVFSIQQPEVHLHPRAQAAFGELMYNSSKEDKSVFFCETHSDFMINRFRYMVNQGSDNEDPSAQVLFFERDDKGLHVTPIIIDSKGHFVNVPSSYMRFFINEELKMLEF